MKGLPTTNKNPQKTGDLYASAFSRFVDVLIVVEVNFSGKGTLAKTNTASVKHSIGKDASRCRNLCG